VSLGTEAPSRGLLVLLVILLVMLPVLPFAFLQDSVVLLLGAGGDRLPLVLILVMLPVLPFAFLQHSVVLLLSVDGDGLSLVLILVIPLLASIDHAFVSLGTEAPSRGHCNHLGEVRGGAGGVELVHVGGQSDAEAGGLREEDAAVADVGILQEAFEGLGLLTDSGQGGVLATTDEVSSDCIVYRRAAVLTLVEAGLGHPVHEPYVASLTRRGVSHFSRENLR